MEPTYIDGDRLLVVHGASPKIGCPHVVRLPDGPGGPRPLAIKRVTHREPDGSWWVERDNPREGVDSALVGALPPAAMKARVVYPQSASAARLLRTCRSWAARLHQSRKWR